MSAQVPTWTRRAWTTHAETTLVTEDATSVTGLRVVAEFDTAENARLGEAAPELLAALNGLLTADAVAIIKENPAAFGPEWHAALAAIAKATGAAQ